MDGSSQLDTASFVYNHSVLTIQEQAALWEKLCTAFSPAPFVRLAPLVPSRGPLPTHGVACWAKSGLGSAGSAPGLRLGSGASSAAGSHGSPPVSEPLPTHCQAMFANASNKADSSMRSTPAPGAAAAPQALPLHHLLDGGPICTPTSGSTPGDSDGLKCDDELLRIFEDMGGDDGGLIGELSSAASVGTSAHFNNRQHRSPPSRSFSPALSGPGAPPPAVPFMGLGPSMDVMPTMALGLQCPPMSSPAALCLPPLDPPLPLPLAPAPPGRSLSMPQLIEAADGGSAVVTTRPRSRTPPTGAAHLTTALRVKAGGVKKTGAAAATYGRKALSPAAVTAERMAGGQTTPAASGASGNGCDTMMDDSEAADATHDGCELLTNNQLCHALGWMEDMTLPGASAIAV